MENIPHSLKNRRKSSAGNFRKFQSDFFDESDRDFDRIVCWIFEKKRQNLKREDFVADLLVHQMRDELAGVEAEIFLISAERAAEDQHKSGEDQFADRREFRVDNRDEAGVYIREGRRRALRL